MLPSNPQVDEDARTVTVAAGIPQRLLLDYLSEYRHWKEPAGGRLHVCAASRCWVGLLGDVCCGCITPLAGHASQQPASPQCALLRPRCHAGWVLPVRAGRCRRAGQGAAQLRAASGRASSHLAAVTESLCCTCSPSPGTPSRRSAVRWLLMQQGGCRAGTATPACVCHRPPSSLCPHAGAVATATHGSTMKHGSLSSQVVCVCVCVCVCGGGGGVGFPWGGGARAPHTPRLPHNCGGQLRASSPAPLQQRFEPGIPLCATPPRPVPPPCLPAPTAGGAPHRAAGQRHLPGRHPRHQPAPVPRRWPPAWGAWAW